MALGGSRGSVESTREAVSHKPLSGDERSPRDNGLLRLRGISRADFCDSGQGYLAHHPVLGGAPGSISTTWQQKGGEFKTPPDAAFLRISLYNYLNTGWVAYDDVSLTKVEGEIEVPVPNPGFEGTTGWSEVRPSEFPGTSFYRSSWGTAAPHSGSYAYVMSNHPYGRLLSEPVLVRPDTEYDLCAWMRGEINPEDGEGLWLIGAYFYDSDGWYVGGLQIAAWILRSIGL